MNVSAARVASRRISNSVFVVFCYVVTAIALVFLAAVLWTLIGKGIGGISLDTFTMDTPASGSRGGLLNAIIGSILLCTLAMAIALFIGILAGTWLAEYAGDGRYGTTVRFINDVLLSAPSILVGLFVWTLLVNDIAGKALLHAAPSAGSVWRSIFGGTLGHFSGFAGSLALSLIAVPVIARTTEDVLRLQPTSLRESGAALGTPLWTVIRTILWRAGGSGILTGALLAFSRISGETAPLLFTALNNQFRSFDMSHEMANLPVVMFNDALSAYDDLQRLAWAAALIVSVSVLGVIIIARVLTREQKKSMNTLAPETFDVSVARVDAPVKLEVKELDFFYGKNHALKGVSIPFAEKSVTALIGPSGCGKSTLLRTLNRMYALYPGQRATGSILLDGEDILRPGVNLSMLRARIGMVFQKPTPFPMSIYDNVAFGVRLYEKLSKGEMDHRVEESLRRAALWDEVKSQLHASGLSLSGGQQQRLCVARGIAVKPEVLLLDEPTSALDPISSAKLEETVTQLKSDYTIIIVTHNLGQAARVSDYTGFMYLGELVEFGETATMFTRPATKRASDYITGRFG